MPSLGDNLGALALNWHLTKQPQYKSWTSLGKCAPIYYEFCRNFMNPTQYIIQDPGKPAIWPTLEPTSLYIAYYNQAKIYLSFPWFGKEKQFPRSQMSTLWWPPQSWQIMGLITSQAALTASWFGIRTSFMWYSFCQFVMCQGNIMSFPVTWCVSPGIWVILLVCIA